MEKLVDFLYRVLRPVLRPVSTWLAASKRRHETWVYERAAVAPVLLAVTALTTDWSSARAIAANWAGAVGVLYTFAHVSVSFRLAEEQAGQAKPAVHCYHMAERYWLIKELAWATAFVAGGMYSALVGSVLFLVYPVWRKIHVENRKLMRERLAPEPEK